MLIRPQSEHRARRQQQSSMLGFSLLEMMIVLCILLIISVFAVFTTQGALKDARVNGAYDTAFMQLRLARERAIEERKRYIVTFGTPAVVGALTPLGLPNAKSIQLYRWDSSVPPAPAPAPVQVATIDLPFDVDFQTLAGVPTTAATVPDGFGNGTVPIDFDQGVGAGGGNLVMFMPDGSARDLLGNFDSGIVYIARTNVLNTSRALTVFGTSGRIRGWRLTFPAAGGPTWRQQ